MHSISNMCKALIKWVPSHTQNLNAIRPVVCEIWKTDVHVRTCRFTPPLTCVEVIARWSLSTHKTWTQSGQRLWSYRWRGCLRHPLLDTCHVPWQAPAGIGVGQIWNLLNGDIEQRTPLVNRSTRSRYISFSKAWWGRVGLVRAYWDFSLKRQKDSLRASRSARNNAGLFSVCLFGCLTKGRWTDHDHIQATMIRFDHGRFQMNTWPYGS